MGGLLAQGPVARVELTTEPVRVALDVAPACRAKFAALAATIRPAHRLILTIEGIGFEKPPGFYWELYLNLPEGETSAAIESEHYVGNLAIYSPAAVSARGAAVGEATVQNESSETVDISESITRLLKRGRFRSDRLTVTFTPQFSGARPRRVAAPPTPDAWFRRVTLRLE